MIDSKWTLKRWLAAMGVAIGVVSLSSCMVMADETEVQEQTEASVESEPQILDSKEAHVYQGTLDSNDVLTTWAVQDQEDIPYVAVDEYLNLLYVEFASPLVEYSWDGNVYKVTRNGVSVEMNLDDQTIYCDDWVEFRGADVPGGDPGSVVQKGEYIAIRPSVVNKSTHTDPDGYGVEMGKYGIEMLRYEDRVLMPFMAVQNVFASPVGQNVLAYNGDDYFDIVSQVDNIYGSVMNSYTMNPYSDKWYSGSFAFRDELSEAYVKYNYGTLCMLLDMTYGHKEEKGITDFDTYLEENGLKKYLVNADVHDDGEALQKLFSGLFDSGHDGETLSPSITDSTLVPGKAALIHILLDMIGFESVSELTQAWQPIAWEIVKLLDMDEMLLESMKPDSSTEETPITGNESFDALGPNMAKLVYHTMRMEILKPLFYGSERIDIEGDTCILYYEAFLEDMTRSESYYVKPPQQSDISKSTFAFFYYAFQEIEEAGNVKNVVIDLSKNGGGSAAGLIAALGFLTDDGEVEFTYLNQMYNSYRADCYHVDTNLDGVFDDQDGFGGQYDFYILTSGYSYSCANALPYFAQKQGLAKIIGEKPGGGDCVVNYYLDAYGHVAMMSGPLKLGTLEGDVFESDETAVTIDIPFPADKADKYYFNPEKIAKFVRGE